MVFLCFCFFCKNEPMKVSYFPITSFFQKQKSTTTFCLVVGSLLKCSLFLKYLPLVFWLLGWLFFWSPHLTSPRRKRFASPHFVIPGEGRSFGSRTGHRNLVKSEKPVVDVGSFFFVLYIPREMFFFLGRKFEITQGKVVCVLFLWWMSPCWSCGVLSSNYPVLSLNRITWPAMCFNL